MNFPEIEHISQDEQKKFYDFLQENYPVPSRSENPYIKFFPDGHYLIAHPLMYHWTIKKGAIGDYNGYSERWCLAYEFLCKEALDKWDDPKQDCPGKWHRHPLSGRRRVWTGDTFRETIQF